MAPEDASTVGRVAPTAAGPSPLPADRLYRKAELGGLAFATTDDLEPLDEFVGQARARDAIKVGTGIERPGFNLFTIGPPQARMREAVLSVLQRIAAERPQPPDWVYVNNFAQPHRPRAIALPPGRAPAFRAAMHELIKDLKASLPAVFESEDYRARRAAIDEAFQHRQNEAFSALREQADRHGILIIRTPLGFALAPGRNGEVVPPEEFNSWPEQKRKAMQEIIQSLEKEFERMMRNVPLWEKERRAEVRKLDSETAELAVDQLTEEARAAFQDLPAILEHLAAVRADLLDNVPLFFVRQEEEVSPTEMQVATPLDRYEVNVLVTQSGLDGCAPVIEELHPTLGNLIGRVEYTSRQGLLVTNFRFIKAGALHRANGGYLLLDARSLLMEPFSWAALKRALGRLDIRTEDPAHLIGLTNTVSLEPDPIPLDIKVVLLGERLLYHLLSLFDPELEQHFKVLADFEDDHERSPESEAVFARLLATVLKREKLRPMEREAVARILEQAARLAEHSGKLTLLLDSLRDTLVEADFEASRRGRGAITAEDVKAAIAERVRRAARLSDRAREHILEEVALIETDGRRIGQVNGLSVFEVGGFSFGRPTRITCQVRPGTGRVVDIEREVALGGPIHSKGVLILSGLLGGRYALDTPMSLQASLVFEQSYSGVEGDSASSAEFYALLSALAEVPLRQDLAVTGSINQHGEIQAIGGVNEKIEGFFDVCRARGLTGRQGVIVPQANVRHLMLREDVIEACAASRFSIYAVATADEGIALLTGLAAGVRDGDGSYPEGSVNRRVEDRLRTFAAVRRSFAALRREEAAEEP